MNPLLPRRVLFRGATLGAGSVPLAPFVRCLAASTPAPPRRVVIVMEGNGLSPLHLQPPSIPRAKHPHGHTNHDRLEDIPLAGHALPEALAPLEPLRDRLCIVQGLSGRICGGGHSNNFGALGCYPAKAGPAGETVDHALPRALPALFPLLGLGISDRAEHTVIQNVSAAGRDQPLPTRCRPDLAYNELFGSVAEGAGAAQFARRGNLLDFMVEDIRRVSRRLDGEERDKLGHYLSAYESLRDRQSRLTEMRGRLARHAPPLDDRFTTGVETDRLAAQFDLAAAALITGLSNVVTLASGCGDPYFSVRWTGLGIPLDKHSIGHGKGLDTRTADQLAVRIRRFHMELIAQLAAKLAAVPEADGTLLDHTLILYLSDAAEAHHSRCWDWPMLMIGDLGGRLRSRGRFLAYPKYGAPEHRTTANLYLTLLAAAGAPRESFGLPDPGLRDLHPQGPLDALLA
jgi:hypothetical protein